MQMARLATGCGRDCNNAYAPAPISKKVSKSTSRDTTTLETKSGYGLSVRDEARSLAVARQFTEETTFLGAHVVPAEHADDPAASARPHKGWSN